MIKDNKMHWETLPMRDNCKNKLMIKWDMVAGNRVNFIHNGVEGYLDIVGYNKEKHKLTVKYNEKEKDIDCYNFKNCRLTWVLGISNTDYKYTVGDIVEVSTGSVRILKQIKIMEGKYNKRWYTYECLNCSNIDNIRETDLYNNVGCNVCCSAPRKVLKGYNDIGTTNPDLAIYFKNIEDTYINTSKSHHKVMLVCPNCGYEKQSRINTLYYSGFCCSKCSDGKSYGEKFIFNLLIELNINFEIEKYFKWSNPLNKLKNRKIYDFYFNYINEDYIIEVHGIQHYLERGWGKNSRSLKDEQENDRLKKELAISNGIKEDNYIIIDCRESETEFIKQNIINGKINKLFELSTIDWNKVSRLANKNKIKEICDMWNIHKNVSTISKIAKLNKATIRTYLKKGNNLKWCDYDGKEAQRKSINPKKISMEVFKDEVSIGVFKSILELIRSVKELHGIRLHHKYLSRVCDTNKEYKGFTFKLSEVKSYDKE